MTGEEWVTDAWLRLPLVAVAAHAFGAFLNGRTRAPKITGYLLAGCALGARGAGALTEGGSRRLAVVDNACLACIGVAAGSEVSLSELRKNARMTVVTIASIAVCAWTLTFVTFDAALASRVEFLRGLTERHVAAVGSLLGTLALARSPASAMAVMNECEARGPFCTHILSTTVAKDIVVVALFAMNVELVALSGLDFHRIVADTLESDSNATAASEKAVKAVVGARKLLVNLKPATQWERAHVLTKMLQPLTRVCGAVIAGGVAGVVLGRLLRPTSLVARWKNVRVACFVSGVAAIFLASEHFALEPLLVCVIAGLTAANRKHSTGEREKEELRGIVSLITPGVNLLFFTLAGASLRLDNAYNSFAIASSLVVVRLIALYCATEISTRLLKAPVVSEVPGERRRNIEWMGHVTQAGVALGLSRTVAARFPYWGPEFATLAVSIIVINLFIGPVLFRTAIELMHESHATLERVASAPPSEIELASSPKPPFTPTDA